MQGDDIVTIEGNTSEFGGRDGDGVYRKIRRREYASIGYLDFGRELPLDVALWRYVDGWVDEFDVAADRDRAGVLVTITEVVAYAAGPMRATLARAH